MLGLKCQTLREGFYREQPSGFPLPIPPAAACCLEPFENVFMLEWMCHGCLELDLKYSWGTDGAGLQHRSLIREPEGRGWYKHFYGWCKHFNGWCKDFDGLCKHFNGWCKHFNLLLSGKLLLTRWKGFATRRVRKYWPRGRVPPCLPAEVKTCLL